jgi:hypothetical protein
MTHKEIEACRKELAEIIDRPPQPNGNPAKSSKEDLQKLARKVGASTRAMYVNPTNARPVGYDAGISDLIDNIHQGLQTATMIDMCKTANRNFFIALVATLIALGSAVALWVAVL